MKSNLILVSAFSLFVLVGCGDSAPSCDSGNVKDSIKEQFRTITKNYQSAIALGAGVFGALNSDGAYNKLKETAKSDQQAAKALEEIEKAIKAIDFSFENVRAESVDDKAKKSICIADMKISGPNGSDKQQLKYLAQTSSNGLIVEIVDIKK